MAGKTLSYFNLTGGLNTVQTMATINSTVNRTESPEMVNIEYFKLSGLRTMNGNVALNSNNSIGSQIDFGYEYIQGNDRYMIVADRSKVYKYISATDTFETIYDFGYNAAINTYITICGYANGIVAACPNNNINYLMYYKEGREQVVGKASTDNPITDTITYTGSQLSALGVGDVIKISNIEYTIETVDTDNNTITLTTIPSAAFSNADITLTNITKIPCVYTSIVEDSGNQTITTTTNFYPKIIQSHQGRLWIGAMIGDDNVASYAIYSDLGNIHNMFEGGDASAYDAGYFAEFWEDSSDITAIGTWDKYVVIHKREHTYLINTSNSDATTWNVESYSEYTCDNQRGFVKANNGYYVYTTSGGGIYPMIQRTIYSAISQGSEASYKIRDTFTNINPYAYDKIFAVYHPIKKYIMFYIPMIGEDGSNNCYIYDIQTKSWLHRRVPQAISCAFEFDNKVYIGTIDGKIYEEFRGLDFAGEPIKFSWKSPWFMWSGGTNWATTAEIRVKMSQEGTNNFFIRNRRDGDESYKQRTITNTTNKVDNLMWDEGILEGDIDRVNYSNSFLIYSYTGDDGETYYSIDNPLTKYSIVHKTLGSTQADYDKIKYFTGGSIAGALINKTAGTSDDWDDVEWGEDAVFAFTWRGTQPQYKCYQSTQDSNVKIWVDSSDTTKGVINLEYKVTNPWYGFNFPPMTGTHVSNTIPAYITKSDYDSKWNTPNSYILLYSQPNVPYTANGISWYVYIGSNPNGTATVNNNDGRRLVFLNGTYYSLYWGNPSTTSVPSSSWEWNGKDTRSGTSIDNQFTYSDSTVIYQGVIYNRYSAGDEGNISSGQTDTVYSSKEVLKVGDTVYGEIGLTTNVGTVEQVDDTNYTINDRIYVPDYSQGYAGTSPQYYKLDANFTFPMVGTSTTKYCNAWYQIPDISNTLSDNEKVLTDTVWDDSKWVNTGQITKRFPIDRQYFQTLQLEFCGEVDNQGIELYGFEVDGIQLTEVPY